MAANSAIMLLWSPPIEFAAAMAYLNPSGRGFKRTNAGNPYRGAHQLRCFLNDLVE
jgi:hypothetical protein